MRFLLSACISLFINLDGLFLNCWNFYVVTKFEIEYKLFKEFLIKNLDTITRSCIDDFILHPTLKRTFLIVVTARY
jgi:hypothetical protein